MPVIYTDRVVEVDISSCRTYKQAATELLAQLNRLEHDGVPPERVCIEVRITKGEG